MLFVIYLAWMSPTYCNSRRECESICVNGITHHFFGNNKNTLLHVEDRAPVETDLSAT
jgi:hypothetical protein